MPAPIQQQVISPDVLEQVGRALYGEQWQTPLARALEMSDRSLRYMANGERGIHAGIAKDLLAIVMHRGAELGKVAKTLQRAIAKGES